MNKSFEVGDMVVVREWDDMKAEFGADSWGINCEFVFTEEMGMFCGREAEITDISQRVISLKFDHPSLTIESREYNFSADMIRLISNEPMEHDVVDDFINSYSTPIAN